MRLLLVAALAALLPLALPSAAAAASGAAGGAGPVGGWCGWGFPTDFAFGATSFLVARASPDDAWRVTLAGSTWCHTGDVVDCPAEGTLATGLFATCGWTWVIYAPEGPCTSPAPGVHVLPARVDVGSVVTDAGGYTSILLHVVLTGDAVAEAGC